MYDIDEKKEATTKKIIKEFTKKIKYKRLKIKTINKPKPKALKHV